jgi:hypothetical protein
MDEALEGLSHLGRIVDDVIIYSKNRQDHEKHVRAFLKRCQEHNIKLNREKVQLSQDSVEFAGTIISKDGYKKQDRIFSDLRKFPFPKDQTAMRQFSGMANQLAPHNKRLAAAMEPIRHLLKKDANFENVDEDTIKAFEKTKLILQSQETMAFYRPGAPLQLYTDASCKNGLGYVLKQRQQDGDWKPIQLGSRSLTDAERRYAPIELELTALVWATKKCRKFLIANHSRY